MKNTTIYVLSSIVLIAVGVIILFATKENSTFNAIGISIVAGGIASIAFGIIRYFDDADARAIRERLIELTQNLKEIQKDHRKIFTRRPEAEVKAAITKENGGQLEVDCVGVTLKNFRTDTLTTLEARNHVTVRLLQMDPRSDLLNRYASEQGEDHKGVIRDICDTSVRISESINAGRLNGDVRWYDGFQSVTLIRINTVIFARMRLVREATLQNAFFECYRKDGDENCYKALNEYFNTLWSDGKEVDLEFCKKHSRR